MLSSPPPDDFFNFFLQGLIFAPEPDDAVYSLSEENSFGESDLVVETFEPLFTPNSNGLWIETEILKRFLLEHYELMRPIAFTFHEGERLLRWPLRSPNVHSVELDLRDDKNVYIGGNIVHSLWFLVDKAKMSFPFHLDAVIYAFKIRSWDCINGWRPNTSLLRILHTETLSSTHMTPATMQTLKEEIGV